MLDQHVHEHGGSRDDAQRELTQLIADLAIEGRVTVSTSGTLVIRRAEYTLIVDQTGSRFVRYKSGLGRITWTQFRRRGETAVWAQRPVPEHAPRAEPVAWDEPGDFVAAIAPGAVRFSRRAFRQAARLMGLLGAIDHG